MAKKYSGRNSGWNRINSPKTTFQIKEFNHQVHLVNGLGEVFTVSPEGSLSTLALGAQGHMAVKLAKELHAKK